MSGIHLFDFAAKPFDGDPRQAHQFIPFLQAQMGAAKLSYILNVKDYPTPQPDEYLVTLERRHHAERQEMMRVYHNKQEQYEQLLLPVYNRRVQQIEEHPRWSEAHKLNEIRALPRPVVPMLPPHESNFTTAMEIQLSKTKDKARQFDADADQAIQLIRKFMSIRIQNKCSPIFHAAEESSRRKLLVIWEWLLSQRLFDPHIVSEIKQDMAMLPEITNFQEALTILGHMNMLQAELQTLRNPMTDLELIICHCQKMSANPKFAEQFVPIKLKYLQTTLTQTADLPPSFSSTPLQPERQEPRTWATYSSDVALHARAHNSVARTSTVLAAVTSSRSNSGRSRNRGFSPQRSEYDKDQGWKDRNRTNRRFNERDRERSRRDTSEGDRYREQRPRTRDHSRDRDRRDRSRDRARSPSADRHLSSRGQRSSSPNKSRDLPYLPDEEYAKFKSEMQAAREEVYKKFYKRPSSSSPAKGQVRSATGDSATQDDSLTDSEVRALRAAISSWNDNSDGDNSDSCSDASDV